MKLYLQHHSLAAMSALLASTALTATAKGSPQEVFIKMGGRDLDPLFMGNIDLNPVSIAGVEKASSAKGLGAVPLVADVPKLPRFDLANMTGVAIDAIALKAHGGGGTTCSKSSGLTKLGTVNADKPPKAFALIFAAGNKDMMAAGELVAQNLAKSARTPAVAFV